MLRQFAPEKIVVRSFPLRQGGVKRSAVGDGLAACLALDRRKEGENGRPKTPADHQWRCSYPHL